MRHEIVARLDDTPVVLMDSISLIGPADQGAVVVCGSHGGAISGAFAARHPPALAFFNDAGVGKRRAGIAALQLLERQDAAAAAVSHMSARIGDAADAWENGIVSHVNEPARRLGIAPGQRVAEAARLATARGDAGGAS